MGEQILPVKNTDSICSEFGVSQENHGVSNYTKLRGFSPQAHYTDPVSAASRRS
jgi:hypothetical protein